MSAAKKMKARLDAMPDALREALAGVPRAPAGRGVRRSPMTKANVFSQPLPATESTPTESTLDNPLGLFEVTTE